MVQCLVGRGADVNAVGEDGLTPLQLAERSGHQEIVEYLERIGPGQTAILAAGEWRPRNHSRFPLDYRAAMRTLVILAKGEQL